MTSARRSFWDHESFAVVGDRERRSFPKLTYRGLKGAGRTVYAVDPSGGEVEGDPTYPDLAGLPAPVEAAVLELPKDEMAEWVGRAADAGIKAVWIHQQTDTPEALALARERGLEVCAGTCAVMYVTPGLSMHAPHRWIMRGLGRF
jgi:predicted CoA-binding protein